MDDIQKIPMKSGLFLLFHASANFLPDVHDPRGFLAQDFSSSEKQWNHKASERSKGLQIET